MIVGERKDIVISIGNLTPVKNGLEVSVEEIDGSKYFISLEYDHNSNMYKGNILCFPYILTYLYIDL